MTTKANILLQNYVDAVHAYREYQSSPHVPGDDLPELEEKMDAAELELTTYINELEQKAGAT